MDSVSNSFGHRSNQLARQRLQHFKGCAIIDFNQLALDQTAENMANMRHRSNKNLERLIKLFEIEGCANLEPEHRVAAIVSAEALNDALLRSNISQDSLFNPQKHQELFFDQGYKLKVIYGNHRLVAAQKVGENQWLVDLYQDGRETPL